MGRTRELHLSYWILKCLSSKLKPLQVELYADYEPRLLLPFLRSSHYYSLDKVQCFYERLVPEVFPLLWICDGNLILCPFILEKSMQTFGADDNSYYDT